jgi:type IV pilus assembly protein PilO
MKFLDKWNKFPVVFKALGLVVILVGVVAFFHYSYWEPLNEKLKTLERQRQELQSQYEEQKAVADNLPTFQANTRKLEEDLANALKLLPREKEIPSLLRDIYTLGRKSGVDFKTFEPQKEAPKQLYAELPIRLSLVGTYHEIAVFFDRIGKMARIVNVSNLDMTQGSGNQDTKSDPKLNVNCSATTFMFLGSRN